MFKKAFQQGHNEREAEAYRGPVAPQSAAGESYVEAWSEARTQLEAFFNILLGTRCPPGEYPPLRESPDRQPVASATGKLGTSI